MGIYVCAKARALSIVSRTGTLMGLMDGLRLSLEGYANKDIRAIMERFVIALFVCPARR